MIIIPGDVELNQRLTILEKTLTELSTRVTFVETKLKKRNNKNKKNKNKNNKKNKKKKYLNGRPPRRNSFINMAMSPRR